MVNHVLFDLSTFKPNKVLMMALLGCISHVCILAADLPILFEMQSFHKAQCLHNFATWLISDNARFHT